jgi:hypothetical protein
MDSTTSKSSISKHDGDNARLRLYARDTVMGHLLRCAASLRGVPQRTGAATHFRTRPRRIGRGFIALIASACAAATVSMPALADDEAPSPRRADGLDRLVDAGGLPPLGMRFDHPPERGHWAFSYRYVRATRSGLIDGHDPVSASSLLGNPYDEVPTSQNDETHLISVAYAPLDRLSFEISLPYVLREQDILTQTGTRQVSASGIGDAQFVFVVPFIHNRDQETHLSVGFTFPTGSIQQVDSNGDRLAYDMQLGSGTWDVVWGITYTGRYERLGWGGEVHGVYRIGENAVGYRQGTVYEASAWLSGMAFKRLAFSGRLGWARRGNVHGLDPTLDPLINPSRDPYKQGSNRLEVGPGMNVLLPVFGGQRLAIEWLVPVYQTVSGPQLEHDWTLTAGFQWLY